MDAVSLGRDLGNLLDSLPDAVIKTDSEWIVEYLNPAAARLLGITRDQPLPADLITVSRQAEQTQAPCRQQHREACLEAEVTVMESGARLIRFRDITEQVRTLQSEISRRKVAETALETSQEFLQAVLDNIEAGIVACDENGTLKLFNNASRAFHGIPEAPIPAEEWPARYALYYPDGTTLLRKEDVPLYRAFSGEVVRNQEIVIASTDGRRRNVLSSGRALIGRNGRKLGAVVAMHDITHRKISGARLRRALQQFRSLFQDAPIAYHEIDKDGNLRRVNRAECRLLGRTREEMIGRPVWEFVLESQRERGRKELFETLSGARPPNTFEREYVTSSGKRLVMEVHNSLILGASGEITGIRGAMLDITDRTQKERERLARQRAEADSAEIRNILERIGDAYMALDTEWRYQYVNRKAAELALKPASELIGRCVWDEFPESVSTPFYSELHRAMRDQTPVEFNSYYAPLDKWFENSVYPSPSGVGVYYRDVTDRVRTQLALEKQTAELGVKNAELETFAYVASHDLQEPLRMIGAYTDLLAQRFSHVLDPDAVQFVEFILQGVGRMERLIRGVLALCRLDSSLEFPPDPVSLHHVVETVCATLDPVIKETGAVIEFHDLPAVRVRETELLQVMQNLIGNALRYRGEAPPTITVRAERQEQGWHISVSDNGIGFAMRYAEQIFLPFKRLRNGLEGGTGIGLAICKKIVESSGGRIWVESVPGAGSTFHFTIPDVK